MSNVNRQLYEFGAFRLDVDERLLTCEGERVPPPARRSDEIGDLGLVLETMRRKLDGKEYKLAEAEYKRSGTASALLANESFTNRQKFEMLPRVVPFVLLLIGVMVALYGGFATPSETAGLGALLALGPTVAWAAVSASSGCFW